MSTLCLLGRCLHFTCTLSYAGNLESEQKMSRAGMSRAGMTPNFTGAMWDKNITLHDNVFMDNCENEPKLEKMFKLHEEVHCEWYLIFEGQYFRGFKFQPSHENLNLEKCTF